MKKTYASIFFYTVFIVCTVAPARSQKHASTTSKKGVNLVKIHKDTIKWQIGCYYELDEKYSDSSNDNEIEQWWNNRLASIKKSGIQNDILSRSAGGPNGAEWNTYTDLYFAIPFLTQLHIKTKPENEYYDPVTVTINEKQINYKIIPRNSYSHGILVDFMIEKEVWNYALQPIEPKDHKLLSQKTYIDTRLFSSTHRVFKITVTIELENNKKMIATDYFYIAYGE